MKAHVRMHNGTPTLFLNDQPHYANVQWVGSLDPTQPVKETQASIRALSAHGIHIYTTDGIGNGWCGVGQGREGDYDLAPVGEMLTNILEADPDGLLNLRILLDSFHMPGNWWNERHPGEQEVLSTGTFQSASFASLKWQEESKAYLSALIAYLREAGLYDRVIGYQLCTGVCGEWIKSWSSMNPPSGDHSEPMQRAFRAWLRRRYQDDVAALRAAWGQPEVTFETAQVPSGDEQSGTTHFVFRDPRRERNVIDFNECYTETATDALLGMCRHVKTLTGGDKLTGAFFGYLMELAWNDAFFSDGHGDRTTSEVSTVQRSSHLGLHKVLRSPDLDFLVSPYSYAFRGMGGDGLPMGPTESLRIHGKLYLFEEDTLMHNSLDPHGRMHPKDQNIPIYQRNFAQIVTHGLGVTWLETGVFPEDERIIDEAHAWHEHYHKIGTWALGLDRRPRADVAVFLDDESYFYEGNWNHLSLPLIAHQRVMALNRFGAPHDLYLLNDLLEGDLPPYRLYIFLNPFHLNDQRRAKLKGILRRDNRTALWYYAPGYLNSDAEPAYHTDWMTDLTGIKFNLTRSYWSQMMHITDFTHPITEGLPQDLFWGTHRHVAPIFHLADPEATVLGEVILALGRCQPGFAIKSFDAGTPQAWHSVYVSAPTLPAAVLRGIARHAGAHLYSEAGDVLYATPDLLAVHTVSGGRRTFTLPRPAEVVYDLFQRREVAAETAAFETQLPPKSTALYYTGSRAGLAPLLAMY